jgi:hypothetical protein
MVYGVLNQIKPFRDLSIALAQSPAQIIKRTISSPDQALGDTPLCNACSDLFLRVDCFRYRMVCPTVFGLAKSVIRRLTSGELASAFDVPWSAIPEDWEKLMDQPIPSTVPPHPLTLAVPLKVLHKVYEMWQQVPYCLSSLVNRAANGQDNTHLWNLPGTMYASGQDFKVEADYRQAVKANDAQVPIHIWNNRIWGAKLHQPDLVSAYQKKYQKCPLDSLREIFLQCWRRLVYRSFLLYLRATYGDKWRSHQQAEPALREDLKHGRDCLHKTAAADWWEWRGVHHFYSGNGLLSFVSWPEMDILFGCRVIYPSTFTLNALSQMPTYVDKSRSS